LAKSLESLRITTAPQGQRCWFPATKELLLQLHVEQQLGQGSLLQPEKEGLLAALLSQEAQRRLLS
jgi:hypothetical protein